MIIVKHKRTGNISFKIDNEHLMLDKFKEKYAGDVRFDENSELEDYLEELGLFYINSKPTTLLAQDLSKKYKGFNKRFKILSRLKRLFKLPNLGILYMKSDGWYLDAVDKETYRIPLFQNGKMVNIEEIFVTKSA